MLIHRGAEGQKIPIFFRASMKWPLAQFSFAIALKTRSGPLFHLPALLYPELCELIGHLIPCWMPGDISFADQLSQGLLDPVPQVGESANQDMLGQMSGLCHARLLAQFNENSPFEVGYHA